MDAKTLFENYSKIEIAYWKAGRDLEVKLNKIFDGFQRFVACEDVLIVYIKEKNIRYFTITPDELKEAEIKKAKEVIGYFVKHNGECNPPNLEYWAEFLANRYKDIKGMADSCSYLIDYARGIQFGPCFIWTSFEELLKV